MSCKICTEYCDCGENIVKTLELNTDETPYALSKGIDVMMKKLLRALKDDMLENRRDLTGYVITLERK